MKTLTILSALCFSVCHMAIGQVTYDLCEGKELVLGSSLEAESYNWYLDGQLLGFDTRQISVTEGGTYSLSTVNGCSSGLSEEIIINIVPVTTARIDVLGEDDGIGNYRAIVPGEGGLNADFEWFVNGIPLGFGPEFSTGISTGTSIELRAKNSLSCYSPFSTHVVGVQPNAINSNKDNLAKLEDGNSVIEIEQHESIDFWLDFNTEGYSLSWDFGDGFFQTGNSAKHYFNQTGTFQVVLTLKNSDSDVLQNAYFHSLVKVNPASIPSTTIDTEKYEEFSVYPSPFVDRITVKAFVPQNGIVKVIIANSNGVVLFIKDFQVQEGINSMEFFNFLENHSAGNYILILEGSGVYKWANLIKK